MSSGFESSRMPGQRESLERRERISLPAFLAPLTFGVAVRVFHLDAQVLAGDELHALNAAVSRSALEILQTWTYFGADYCIPLASFFRLWMDVGIPLSEGVLRAPSLLAGAAAIIVMPALFAPRIGRRAAMWMAWLVALSPSLVLYSRIVRSYMPMTLLSVSTVLVFEHWWRTHSRRSAAAYIVLSGMAVYFHLGAAPFVFAPFVFALGQILHRALRRRSVAELKQATQRCAVLSAFALAFLGLLLWPARSSLIDLLGLHGDGRFPGAGIWSETLKLQLGTPLTFMAGVSAAIALRGAVILARRAPAFTAYLATVSIVQIAALGLLSPHHLEYLHVASRYVLPLLPLLLAMLALGLTSPWPAVNSPRGHRMQGATQVAFFVLLFATGPLAQQSYRYGSFLHSETALTFTVAQDRVELADVPSFYRELSERARGDERIIEFPWMNVSAHAFAAYQRVHRRPVRVASLNRLHGDPRLALRNTLSPKPESLLASGARYLVVHLDLPTEEARVITRDPTFETRLKEMDELWRILGTAGAQMAARIEREWGPPDFLDTAIRVWDLAAVRARHVRSGPS